MENGTTTQATTVQLDETTTLTVNYEASLGELLISLLLFILLMFQLVKWGHGIIFRR